MGRLAPIALRTDPGLTLSCALDQPHAHRACTQPTTCTCTCHTGDPK